MRTIIAGSRTVTDPTAVVRAMANVPFRPSVVLCGCARGADRLGEIWALIHGIPVEYYPADWDAWGKSAGYIRNREMSRTADALVAIWDGASRGTRHMIQMMDGRPTFVLYTR